MIVPEKLRQGDTIGVFAPSDAVELEVKHWVDAGIERLRSMGFQVISGETLDMKHYYSAGTAEERWDDFRSLIANEDVKMIVTAMGGDSAHQILPLMDFDLISENPKIIMGYSDPTVILNPIAEKSRLVTFYGFHAASFDPNWEWFGDYDLEHFARILQDGSAPIEIKPSAPRETWRGGTAEGAFVGGCLGDLVKVVGTPFEPDWTGKILILEHVNQTPLHLNVDITHLKQAGVFGRISGLLLGKFFGCTDRNESWNRPLKELLLDELGEFDFPILKTEDFGHFSHICPIPIGCQGRFYADSKTLEIVERCVQ